jgi:ribosome biogenesis GTPase A
MSPQAFGTVNLARMLIRDARSELNTGSRISADVDAELAACQRRLDEPLRVALAGTLKSGKSTLLNALVGEEIAPTDATECTRVVTWFSGSAGPRIELTHDGGRRTSLPVRRTDGRLRLDLGSVTADRVERVEVGWPSSLLDQYTLVDTPGTASNSHDVSARTLAFLTPGGGDLRG